MFVGYMQAEGVPQGSYSWCYSQVSGWGAEKEVETASWLKG